jgi:pimeloyl-ACP methyl ester carboxylesterase
MAKRTILLIHGMFMTYRCWEAWVRRYSGRGYHVVALPWPGREATVEELNRRHPDPQLAELTFRRVVDHHAEAVRAMGEATIVIGHSMGGLVTQSLLQRGLGSVGVAIDSAPPAGILVPSVSLLRANWPVLNPFLSSSRPYRMSLARFQFAFVNGMPLETQESVYHAQVVPESLRVPRESRWKSERIDFARPHAPLLLTAGSNDHIIPPSLNRENFERYRRASASTVEFHEFPGRNHFGVLGGPNWEEVADFALDWAERQLPEG